MTARALTVAIPTYGRDRELVETLEALFRQDEPPTEALIVDQTPRHDEATEARLRAWRDAGALRWLRLERPSITSAMNTALVEAACEFVLFLDDDIVPGPGLLKAHRQAISAPGVWAVCGQVLQPGESPVDAPALSGRRGFYADLDFIFASTRPATIENVMAGNLCVHRDRALQVGGFDENFVGAAYRFETEFARRLVQAGGRIIFAPEAGIRHLQAARGGTRSRGAHLASMAPDHGVGDYYFAIRHGLSATTLGYMLRRPGRETLTRFHLRRPWYIPLKLVGELRALLLAFRLAARGPRYVDGESAPARDAAE